MDDQTAVRIMAIILLPFVMLGMVFYVWYKATCSALDLLAAGTEKSIEWIVDGLQKLGVIG